MTDHRKLPRAIRRLFRLPATRERMMRELDDEIRFHVETHVEALKAKGLSDDDALAAALARFGDAEDLRAYCGQIADRRDRVGRVRDWFDAIVQDLQFALRQLARARGFTATALIMLALGIGANAAMFSVVYDQLISPLPFPDGNRMVYLRQTSNGGMFLVETPPRLAAAWRTRARTVTDIIASSTHTFIVGDSSRGTAEEVTGAELTPAGFSYFGVRPLIGRTLVAADTAADATPVAILGEAYWRRAFGGSRDVLGTRLQLNGVAHTIVGVMPASFFVPFYEAKDVFTSLRGPQVGRDLNLFGKLRPGVTINEANREIATLFPPKSDLNPLDDPPKLTREVDRSGRELRMMILTLFGAVGFVLLIACANVANLSLARAWNRQREFAVRSALGAGRWRIARQVVTESLVLGVAAGVLGVIVLLAIAKGVESSGVVGNAYRHIAVGRAAIAWTAIVSVLAGLLFGIAPAFAASSPSVNESLKAGARSATGGVLGRRLRSTLVIGELALSVVLLAGAGLLIRTLVALNHVDAGFESRDLYAVKLSGLTAKRFPDPAARRAVFDAVIENVGAIPGVRAVTSAWSLPPNFSHAPGVLQIEGRATTSADSLRSSRFNGVSPEFFAVAGLRIVRGRTFTPTSATTERTGLDETIVNESFARANWPNGDAIGARIRRDTGPWATIVGVVSDVRLPAVKDRTRSVQLYERAATVPSSASSIIARSALPASVLEPAIARAIHDANAAIKVGPLLSSQTLIAQSMAPQKSVLSLLGAFAALAMVLAALGLHGVIAYTVSQRTREIGVRIALGARSEDVLGLVIGQGIRLSLVGVAIGLVGAIGLSRLLRALLYGVTPNDLLTFGAVGLLLVLIAIIATYVPARRAAAVDPIEALRAD